MQTILPEHQAEQRNCLILGSLLYSTIFIFILFKINVNN